MASDYNFTRFERRHVVEDVARTLSGISPAPSTFAPDFALADADGRPFRLSAHRDRPVLLRFASYT